MKISSFGGVLGFAPYQGFLPAQNQAPPTTNQTLLDVARGTLRRQSHIDDTTHSGSFGAQGSDVGCIGFQVVAEVVWDLRNPPNFLAQSGFQGWEQDFDLGYQMWMYVGSGANYPSDTPPYYYFCPSVKGNLIETIMDAVGKKKVRARIDLIGNAPLFALNVTGSGLEMPLYNSYIQHCQTRNWVW